MPQLNMKTASAYRWEIDEPVELIPPATNKVVLYQIEAKGEVSTPGGTMLAVNLLQKVDLATPGADYAVKLGNVRLMQYGQLSPNAPPVFYWDDKFWLPAKDQYNNVFYKQHLNVFYEVAIANEKKVLRDLQAP